MMHNESLVLGTVGAQSIRLTPPTVRSSLQHAEGIAASLGTCDAESSLAAYWSLATRIQQWQQIVDRIGLLTARKACFVEIGSGMGLFVLTGKALGFDIVGVESSSNRYESSLGIARSLFHDNDMPLSMVQSYSETLALPSAAFDLVASFQTFEHVTDLRQTLQEIRRILKPGGLLFAQAPNYRSLYEAHYGVLVPLGLGKSWVHRYLRLRGRPTDFLAHIQWLSPQALRTMFEEVGFSSVEITPISAPANSSEQLTASLLPLPFVSRRGALSLRIAYVLARLLKKLRLGSELYPQLQIWATV